MLCFDEVQVMDVADAAILSSVLSRLFDAGWVIQYVLKMVIFRGP